MGGIPEPGEGFKNKLESGNWSQAIRKGTALECIWLIPRAGWGSEGEAARRIAELAKGGAVGAEEGRLAVDTIMEAISAKSRDINLLVCEAHSHIEAMTAICRKHPSIRLDEGHIRMLESLVISPLRHVAMTNIAGEALALLGDERSLEVLRYHAQCPLDNSETIGPHDKYAIRERLSNSASILAQRLGLDQGIFSRRRGADKAGPREERKAIKTRAG